MYSRSAKAAISGAFVGGFGEAEMTVHFRRAFEQFLERIPAQRQRRRDSPTELHSE